MKKPEIKTKKMCLSNLEGKLTHSEMENIMAGTGGAYCALAGFLFIPGMASGFNSPFWTANARACWNS